MNKLPGYLNSNQSEKQDINSEFRNLITKIKTEGYESAPRDQKVKEVYMYTMPLDPTRVLLDFKTRPFNFKYLAGELAWYLKRERNIEYISKFSSFWSKLTDNRGEINSNYGNLLFGEQLHWCLNALKNDKNTRQAIAFLNRPQFQYQGNKDFVCTMYLNFFIREDTLHMKMTIRSNDMFFGLSYDAPFFSLILQQMRLWLLGTYPKLKLGTYFHYADNIHFYERHFEVADKIEQDVEAVSPNFELKHPLFTLGKTPEDIFFPTYTEMFFEKMEELIANNGSQEDFKAALDIFLVNKK